MIMVHGLIEAKALVKEAIQNGTIYDLDNARYISHSGAHVGDVLIERSGQVILRVYPTESIPGIFDTKFIHIGNVTD